MWGIIGAFLFIIYIVAFIILFFGMSGSETSFLMHLLKCVFWPVIVLVSLFAIVIANIAAQKKEDKAKKE